jgi:hypothetical protein
MPVRYGTAALPTGPRPAHSGSTRTACQNKPHCAAQRALDEIRSRIGTAASRGAVIELEQGPISRSRQPDATTSRWRPWPNPRLRMFRLVQHEWEETGMHVRDLRAGHPEIAGGSVHHVQAVSSGVTPSPPSRCWGTRNAVAATRFTTVPDTQKALSRLGKGLDLRKLVAGAGFEPATSGL